MTAPARFGDTLKATVEFPNRGVYVVDSAKKFKRRQSGGSEVHAVLEAIRSGFNNRDAALLASVYAEDAEYTIVNRNNPPAKRLVLHGREAIRRMFEDMCAREMTHQLAHTMAGEGAIAYSTLCQYPDGCQVVGLNMATLKNGRIVSEFSVDCWDE